MNTWLMRQHKLLSPKPGPSKQTVLLVIRIALTIIIGLDMFVALMNESAILFGILAVLCYITMIEEFISGKKFFGKIMTVLTLCNIGLSIFFEWLHFLT